MRRAVSGFFGCPPLYFPISTLLSLSVNILVTGAAGFIGAALCRRLLADSRNEVTGVDNLNAYYDPRIKIDRLALLGVKPEHDRVLSSAVPATGRTRQRVEFPDFPAMTPVEDSHDGRFRFIKADIANFEDIDKIFGMIRPDVVVNLAAQAGVRYSIDNPFAYVRSNLDGFINVLEGVRQYNTPLLIYASSSSVYGDNSKIPFSETDRVDNPVSLYAATKKSNELMASTYSRLYSLACIGLRFFTVYGPWGRPDMAPMLFAGAMMEGEPIKVFNYGDMSRDFTYIDDIVEGIVKVMDKYYSDRVQSLREREVINEIFNIGRGEPMRLMEFISILEEELGVEAKKIMLPMQPGDVPVTFADTSRLHEAVGYSPRVDLRDGIKQFAQWYKERY